MENEKIDFLILQIKEFRKEAGDSINDLKKDMDKRFDSIEKKFEKIEDRQQNESKINAKQEVQIENLENDLTGLSKRVDNKFVCIDEEQKKNIIFQTRFGIIWSLAIIVINTVILYFINKFLH